MKIVFLVCAVAWAILSIVIGETYPIVISQIWFMGSFLLPKKEDTSTAFHSMYLDPDGEWVRLPDHLAALAAAEEKGRREMREEGVDSIRDLVSRLRMKMQAAKLESKAARHYLDLIDILEETIFMLSTLPDKKEGAS